MPKYSTVRVDIAEQLEVVTDSLKDLGRTLKAAVRKRRPKRASRSVLRGAVAMAITTPAGCEVAERCIKFNGVVHPQLRPCSHEDGTEECVHLQCWTCRKDAGHVVGRIWGQSNVASVPQVFVGAQLDGLGGDAKCTKGYGPCAFTDVATTDDDAELP